MSKNGLILLTPTSISYAGGSASISANGSVSFSAAYIGLNGVFTADYENYMIVCRYNKSGSDRTNYIRLRQGGTETTTGYTWQRLIADATTLSAARTADNAGIVSQSWTGDKNGFVGHMYGPYLAQATAFRSITVHGQSNAGIQDGVWTHSLTNSYDGFTFYTALYEGQTGRIAVYGMRK